MPKVEIVDMKQEINAEGKSMLISRPLSAALQNVLERGKQAILFLNRRGFHTFVCCYGCGYVFKCRNCSVSLTHHAKEGVLKCHYCDFSIKALPLCPVCKDGRIGTFGMGTEKLEEQITARFPGARLQRMDSDVMTGKGIYEQVLRRFDRREIDILIGTQMVTKGHDFPHVLVVGVISADTSLNIPDFRASERAFQVLTQVSGRGGRGEEPGRVFIQTFNPDHFAIRLAAGHDYRGFYDAEIALRKEFSYPPFSRIASIWITGNAQDKVQSCAAQLGEIARSLAKGKPLEVMGPAEAPISRVKGRYRWHLLLKGGTIRELHFLAREIVQRTPRALAVKVDIDPLNFM
jgi:primosomal protein N' (replication factor Y)